LMKGVKIYRTPSNMEHDLSLLKKMNIDTVLLGDEASKDQKFIRVLKNSGIETLIVFPVFFNPQYLKNNDNSWSITESGEKASCSWVKFVCPSNKKHLKYQVEKISEIARSFQPDGITLDFMRFFAFWEMIKPETPFDEISHGCFCSTCISDFSNITELPTNITGIELNRWILNNRLNLWSSWKQERISSIAEKLIRAVKKINSELKTAIHIVPWPSFEFNGGIESIFGQNSERLSELCDFLTPMTYAPMCFRDSAWIKRVVTDMQSKSDKPVIPAIQVSKAYDEPPVSSEKFRADLMSALSSPSEGVLLWSWEALKESPDKMQIFEECQYFLTERK
jgi:hypothetical protein